jgi:hypothetical protein
MKLNCKVTYIRVGQLFTGDRFLDSSQREYTVVRLTPSCLYLRRPGDDQILRASVSHHEKVALLED